METETTSIRIGTAGKAEQTLFLLEVTLTSTTHDIVVDHKPAEIRTP